MADGVSQQLTVVVRTALTELELDWAETGSGLFTITLPGTRKLTTECALEIGSYGLNLRAFVCRAPDENQAVVYRWLLERNLKLYAIRFCLDTLGDIYLSAKLAGELISPEEIDRLLGAVAETADASFNTVLELGFATSIRQEWAWRRARGESTANLAAFTHLDPGPPSAGGHQV